MKKLFISLLAVSAVLVSGVLSSCTDAHEDLSNNTPVSVSFSIGLDAQSRAAQSLNLDLYDAKMYLYEGVMDESGKLSFAQVNEYEIEENILTISDLTPKTTYKAVFLAIPKGQTPGLPGFRGGDFCPPYEEALVEYINGKETDTDNNIFRSVLTFTASSSSSGTQSTVLTRQNGALEIRINNMPGMESVKLHLNGHTSMLLCDGTGGQVITSGREVALSQTLTDGLSASEVRVKINLLPQEDLTDKDGANNYLEITANGVTTKYPIKSDHSMIPVYPNQVTWLTLGDASGNFDVSFSGGINLDDNEWDGWN